MAPPSHLLPGFDAEQAERDAHDLVQSFVAALADVIQVAESLVAGGRAIDLDGLDRVIGVLCARALDLQPHQGRSVVPQLIALIADLDGLLAALPPAELN